MTKEERTVQLRVRPEGRGFVKLSFEQGNGNVLSETTLQYPESGMLLNEDPRDVVNARQLQKSATALNAMLFELAS